MSLPNRIQVRQVELALMTFRGKYKLKNKIFGSRDSRLTRDDMELLGLHFYREAIHKLKNDENLQVSKMSSRRLQELIDEIVTDDEE